MEVETEATKQTWVLLTLFHSGFNLRQHHYLLFLLEFLLKCHQGSQILKPTEATVCIVLYPTKGFFPGSV